MIKLPTIFKPVFEFSRQHSPAILTAIGCVGTVTTAVLSARGYKKACDILAYEVMRRDKEAEQEVAPGVTYKEMTPITIDLWDKVELTWQCYAAPVFTGALTITCIIFANKINLTRNAALAAAYEMSRTAYSDYRAHVVERLGEKKEAEMRGEIAQKRILDNPPTETQMIVCGNDILCMDSTSGRYFRMSIENIRSIENELNKRLITEMWISLNDLYYELGLEKTTAGNELGWDVNRDGFIHFSYDSALDPNNNPCLVLGFLVGPRPDYKSNV